MTKILVVLAMLMLAASVFVYGKKTRNGDPEPPQDTARAVGAADQYQALVAEMRILQKNNAGMVSVGTYGISDDGRDCIFVRLGTADKPKILIESGLRAGDGRTVATTMNLLRMLLANKREPDIDWLLENREVYFIPVVSPDAFAKGAERNCAFPDGTKVVATNSSIRSLVDFANEMKFKAVLSLHSDGENIAQPVSVRSKDHRAVSRLVESMSAASGMRVGEKSLSDDVNWFYKTGSCSVVMNVGAAAPRAYDAAIAFLRESTEHEMNPVPIRPIFYQAD